MAKERTFLGLSSGWAADGVDAALVCIAGRGERMKVRQIRCVHHPFEEALRRRILGVSQGAAAPAGELAKLDREVASAFTAAAEMSIRAANIERGQIAAVGSSGQMVARAAAKTGVAGSVMVLGSPAVIAERTQLPVAAGFVAGDLAAGGCGGAITAWPDWLIFRDKRLSRVVVHLGGIVSMTVVPASSVTTDAIAFDAGPGTIVLDGLSRRLFQEPFDRDGGLAARGTVSGSLLNEMLACSYFRAGWPKVTSAGEWNDVYLDRLTIMAEKRHCRSADLIATCTEMVARSVTDAIGRLIERPHEIVLAGGGARNIELAGRIRKLLSPSSTYAIGHYGFDLAGYSAICRAVLAAARTDGIAAHCPRATGASGEAVLGCVWKP